MNLVALISAAIGVGLLSLVVLFGNKLANRWLRYLTIVVGILIAIAITGSLPALIGDTDISTSSKAGEYLLYLGILFAGIKSLFFRNKKSVKPLLNSHDPVRPLKISPQKVQENVASGTPPEPLREVPQKSLTCPSLQESKLCPSCMKDMVKRRASNGPHAGQIFWVCSEFPTCKTVLHTEEQHG